MNKTLAFLSVMTATLLVMGPAAFAAPQTIPADPTGGAMGDVVGGVSEWVVDYGAPALFLLILLGILIRLGVRWMKRAGRSV